MHSVLVTNEVWKNSNPEAANSCEHHTHANDSGDSIPHTHRRSSI